MQSRFATVASIVSICTAPVLAASIVGEDTCTQGPAYWCASEANASKCNFADPDINCQKYCEDLIGSPFCDDIMQEPLPEETATLGSDPCTWGPDYWCASEENAKECGLENAKTECQKYCTDLEDSPFCEPLVGSDPCTWGPSYWCASEENAKVCEFENPEKNCKQYCTDLENSPFCTEPDVVGNDPCTWGPSYWCASEENAKECKFDNAKTECKKYCADIAESPFC